MTKDALDTTSGQAVSGDGTITGDGVNLRMGPSTNYGALGQLYKGDTGKLVRVYPNINGPKWFLFYVQKAAQTASVGMEGWVDADYISTRNVIPAP